MLPPWRVLRPTTPRRSWARPCSATDSTAAINFATQQPSLGPTGCHATLTRHHVNVLARAVLNLYSVWRGFSMTQADRTNRDTRLAATTYIHRNALSVTPHKAQHWERHGAKPKRLAGGNNFHWRPARL